MRTQRIIDEIGKLPIDQRMLIIEEAIKAIRLKKTRAQLSQAAGELLPHYVSDSELTTFTDLDLEDF